MLIDRCYAFVMNVRSLLDAPSYQLAEGHELRRAINDEIDRIKQTIASLGGEEFPDYRLWEDRLEELCPASPQEPSVRIVRKPGSASPKDEWRYYVLALHGDIDILNELLPAFDLSRVELEIGFTIAHFQIGGEQRLVKHYDSARLFHTINAAKSRGGDSLGEVSADDVKEIVSIHTSLRTHDHKLVDLERPLDLMRDLKRLPHESPLRFVGYFTILESLLTHQQKDTDNHDSITRQVKTKLALLDHRFERAIDYSDFADPLDRVWSKMYAYRSKVAHGGMPDFKTDLAVLKSPKHALSLLKETTKALIKHTLSDPKLIRDLRQC